MIRQEVERNFRAKMGALLLKPALEEREGSDGLF